MIFCFLRSLHCDARVPLFFSFALLRRTVALDFFFVHVISLHFGGRRFTFSFPVLPLALARCLPFVLLYCAARHPWVLFLFALLSRTVALDYFLVALLPRTVVVGLFFGSPHHPPHVGLLVVILFALLCRTVLVGYSLISIVPQGSHGVCGGCSVVDPNLAFGTLCDLGTDRTEPAKWLKCA